MALPCGLRNRAPFGERKGAHPHAGKVVDAARGLGEDTGNAEMHNPLVTNRGPPIFQRASVNHPPSGEQAQIRLRTLSCTYPPQGLFLALQSGVRSAKLNTYTYIHSVRSVFPAAHPRGVELRG